jgi:hypothetical protein
VCVILYTIFRLIVVLFCVKCVVCVLCLIVVPLPPGENPFAVKINNNNKIMMAYGDGGMAGHILSLVIGRRCQLHALCLLLPEKYRLHVFEARLNAVEKRILSCDYLIVQPAS